MTESINWNQPAQLMTISTAVMEADGSMRTSGPTVASGTLSEVIAAYQQMPRHRIAKARVVIAGGFHVDGAEIDDLVASRGD